MSSPSSPAESATAAATADGPRDFIRQIVREDLAAGRHVAIHTRFPP